jgi:hypothetical protein
MAQSSSLTHHVYTCSKQGHTDKAAAARGGESVIPSKAKAKRGEAQLGASLQMEALSSAAG